MQFHANSLVKRAFFKVSVPKNLFSPFLFNLLYRKGSIRRRMEVEF